MRKNNKNNIHILILVIVSILTLIHSTILSPIEVERSGSGASDGLIDPNALKTSLKIESHKAPGIPQDEIPDAYMEDFEYARSKNERKIWLLKAKTGKLFKSQSEILENQENIYAKGNVLIEIYSKNINKDDFFTIKGEELSFSANENFIELFDTVNIATERGISIEGCYLKYDRNSKIVELPLKCEGEACKESSCKLKKGRGLKRKDKELRFKSNIVKYDINTKELELSKNVEITILDINGKEALNTKIISDKALINLETKIIDILMDDEDIDKFTLISKPQNLEAKARKVSIALDKNNDPFRITAYEDIEIKLDDEKNKYIATCQKAEFNIDKNEIYLTDHARIKQGENIIDGKEFIIYLKTNHIEVNSANAVTNVN